MESSKEQPKQHTEQKEMSPQANSPKNIKSDSKFTGPFAYNNELTRP